MCWSLRKLFHYWKGKGQLHPVPRLKIWVKNCLKKPINLINIVVAYTSLLALGWAVACPLWWRLLTSVASVLRQATYAFTRYSLLGNSESGLFSRKAEHAKGVSRTKGKVKKPQRKNWEIQTVMSMTWLQPPSSVMSALDRSKLGTFFFFRGMPGSHSIGEKTGKQRNKRQACNDFYLKWGKKHSLSSFPPVSYEAEWVEKQMD